MPEDGTGTRCTEFNVDRGLSGNIDNILSNKNRLQYNLTATCNVGYIEKKLPS
jgi:hypothetical protein